MGYKNDKKWIHNSCCTDNGDAFVIDQDYLSGS